MILYLVGGSTKLFSGDASLVKNYRPISLLSNASKILEHLIYNKIIDHLAPWSLITHHQFGFKKGKSAVQQCLVFLHHIFSSSCQTNWYICSMLLLGDLGACPPENFFKIAHLEIESEDIFKNTDVYRDNF